MRMKHSFARWLILVPLIAGCGQNPDTAEFDKEWEERTQAQWDDYDRQLKLVDEQLARQDGQNRRFDKLLDKWEEQARRQDAILDAMEKQYGIRK